MQHETHTCKLAHMNCMHSFCACATQHMHIVSTCASYTHRNLILLRDKGHKLGIAIAGSSYHSPHGGQRFDVDFQFGYWLAVGGS